MAAVALLSVTMNAQAVAEEARTCAARGEALAHLSNKYAMISHGLDGSLITRSVVLAPARRHWGYGTACLQGCQRR